MTLFDVFIFNFEEILHIVPMFPSLILNKYMAAGERCIYGWL